MGLSTAAAAGLNSMVPGAGAAAGMAALTPWIAPVAIGTTLISGILNLMATQDANEKAAAENAVERQDKLAAQRASDVRLDKATKLAERSQKFSEKEATLNRAERTDQTGYNRMQTAYQRGADLWSQSMNAQQAKVAPLIRRV